jgi:DMSO/TMAO reductase YedYZ heme-binding membrane subunit
MRVLLVLLAAAVLAAPFGITAHHFGTMFRDPEETLEILGRLSSLIAVSFIFLDMMTGSFRPLLNRVVNPYRLNRAHISFGITGLAFATAHFVLLIPGLGDHYEESNKVLFFAGPVALTLLILTISTALAVKKMPRTWRIIHLINYIIFPLAILHGLTIGEDRSMLAMRLLFYGFLVLAAAGLVYRTWTPEWRSRLRMSLFGTQRSHESRGRAN